MPLSSKKEAKDLAKKLSELELTPIPCTAVPFVYASADDFDHHRQYETEAVSYWKSNQSEGLFITHVKWKEGETEHKVSHLDHPCLPLTELVAVQMPARRLMDHRVQS